MTATVTVETVVTEDAAPFVDPYRVSLVPGSDAVATNFHADSSAAHLYPGPTLHPDAPTVAPGPALHPGPALDPTNGPVPEPAAYVYGYRVRVGGTDPVSGTLVASRGFCAGMTCDPDAPCDTFVTLSGSPYRTGSSIPATFTAAALGAIADGIVQVNVYAFTSSEGWSI